MRMAPRLTVRALRIMTVTRPESSRVIYSQRSTGPRLPPARPRNWVMIIPLSRAGSHQ